jgi:hypothetical protein
MKYTVLILIAILSFTSQASAQPIEVPDQEKGDFLLVTFFEEKGGGLGQNSAILVTAGKKINEKRSLNRPFDEENLVALANVLNAVKNKGYKLIHTAGAGSGGQNDTDRQSYFIFQKE